MIQLRTFKAYTVAYRLHDQLINSVTDNNEGSIVILKDSISSYISSSIIEILKGILVIPCVNDKEYGLNS